MASTWVRVLRGLAHRGAATALLALLAIVAAAASAAAPAYDGAARRAIVQATLDQAPASAGQLEVTASASKDTTAEGLAQSVTTILDANDGGHADLFAPTVIAIESSGDFGGGVSAPVVFRTAVCATLHLVSGRCPTAPDEALISSTDDASGLGPAQAASAHLRVVGIYTAPRTTTAAFFGRESIYFGGTIGESYDAVFVTEPTMARFGGGKVVTDVQLSTHRLSPAEIDAASRAYVAVQGDQTLQAADDDTDQVLDGVVHAIHQGYRTLSVPTVIATGSLLVLTWLLLYLVVTEDVETRGSEIALARLRGLGRTRVLATAVAEPLVVLLLAIPVGTLLGWLAAHLLARSLFGGLPVGLPAASWLAAVVAVVGGVAAVAVAARRALARGVLDQWRTTTRTGPRRAWIFDAVIVTAAVAGLVELGVTGNVTSSSAGVQVELVPSLLALAVATVLSRVLPPACRGVARITRRRKGLALFLAVRHVGRRPGGTRSVMALASAVAIALFGVAAWSVGRDARVEVARVAVGAPTVLTVQLPDHLDLATAVEKADPSGHHAVGVSRLDQTGVTLLAVDPVRFAAVASWAAGTPTAAVASKLHPPASAPTTFAGTGVRITLTGPGVDRLRLGARIVTSGQPVDTDLVPGPGGTFVDDQLSGCPCTLDALALSGPPQTSPTGTVILAKVEARDGTGWHDLGHGATVNWLDDGLDPTTTVSRTPAGLSWSYSVGPNGFSGIDSADRPDPLPVVIAGGSDPSVAASAIGATQQGPGLDGNESTVTPVAVASSIPGAPVTGYVVDRSYALLASGGQNLGQDQVWIDGDQTSIERSLAAQKVQILSTATTSQHLGQLQKQGPALATALLLFDAVVTAFIAAVGAVVALVADGRRRRYEYAALVAAGAKRSLVRRSLLLEQVIVLGFGLVVGVGAGLVGIALAVPRVPVFVDRPVAPPLDLTPHVGPIALAVLVGVAAVLVTAAVTAGLLARSVRPSALREGTA